MIQRMLPEEELDANDPDSRDPDFIRNYGLPAVEFLRENYFRTTYEGHENIPESGPLMVVSNHSGGPILPDCWVMLSIYWKLFGVERPAYAMVHDVAFRVPVVREVLLKLGALRASKENAEKVLDRGGVLLVFPGGELDCYRTYWRRNEVNFFGRTGFIRMAMRRGVDIVPVVNVGGHETAFTLLSSERLARWSGLQKLTRIKTVPVTVGLPWGIWPTGFLPFLPLPAKFAYKAGKPFRFRSDAKLYEDERVVQRAYVGIVDSMQDMVDELASRRRLPVIG
jgi:1-acyl-sn-glycerol-3-phosphate acyltransferase